MATAGVMVPSDKCYVKAYMSKRQKEKLEKFSKKTGKPMYKIVCEALKQYLD